MVARTGERLTPALGEPRARTAPRRLLRSLLLAWTTLAVVPGVWAQGRAADGDAKDPAPRVLACYWGLDRATDVTFLGFQKVRAFVPRASEFGRRGVT